MQGSRCRCTLRAMATGACVALAGIAAIPFAQAGERTTEDDAEYQRFLTENAAQKERITAVELAVAGDEELEASLSSYSDSLNDHPELAEIESALAKGTEEDAELLALETKLEEIAAQIPESSVREATMDSVVSADAVLARNLLNLEKAAAAEPDLLTEHGVAMAYLESHPEEAEAVFANESGPTYEGDDPGIFAYVGYLAERPPLYRAHWLVYHGLRDRPKTRRIVYAHWEWYRPHPRLWRAQWAHRMRAAQAPRYHRALWKRRLYFGRHPELARFVRRHRALVTGKPALRDHVQFLRRHPQAAKAVVQHRRWVKQQHPHLAKPPPKSQKKPAREAPERPVRRKAKPKAKTHGH